MTGGEIEIWQTPDEGATWAKLKSLTRDSPRDHTYVRQPLKAHEGFYAFWADGDTTRPSESSLYFTDKRGSGVWRLPAELMGEFEPPAEIFKRP
jgi:hypothetical protein